MFVTPRLFLEAQDETDNGLRYCGTSGKEPQCKKTQPLQFVPELRFHDLASVMQAYITDAAFFDRMNTVYKAYFKDPKPARTTVVVSKLVGAGHVEITATARK